MPETTTDAAATAPPRPRGRPGHDRETVLRRAIDDQLARPVSAAADGGTLRADIEPLLVSRLVSGMDNSLVERYDRAGPLDAEKLAAAISTVVFDGFHAESSACDC